MRVRVVVADQSEARFYDVKRRPGSLEFVARLSDPYARLHDRDFKSDRPGRVFDRAAAGGGKRRGATAHHATGGERRPRRHEAEVFARQIAVALESGQRRGGFDAVILIAEPLFLGLLRAALPASVRAIVLSESAKDLVHQSVDVVINHLPPEALSAVQ